MHERSLYWERIRPFIDTSVIKIITGMRRVGKSCILKIINEKLKREHDPKAHMWRTSTVTDTDLSQGLASGQGYYELDREGLKKLLLRLRALPDAAWWEESLEFWITGG